MFHSSHERKLLLIFREHDFFPELEEILIIFLPTSSKIVPSKWEKKRNLSLGQLAGILLVMTVVL